MPPQLSALGVPGKSWPVLVLLILPVGSEGDEGLVSGLPAQVRRKRGVLGHERC